jgi:hypothetical protein
MASNTPVTGNSSVRTARKLPRTPPEERFWKRYSPHGELPLSGVGSLALHALVVGTLVLWSWLLWNKFNNWKPSLPVDTVQFRGGGGGNIHGVGDASGAGQGLKEAVEADEPAQQKPADSTPTTLPQLPTAEAKRVESQFEPATAQRFISKNRTQAMDAFVHLDEKARASFRPRDPDGVQPGKGQGGPGSGGGLGEGRGTGEGPGVGPGKARLTKREERMLRWSMRFSTQNGADYLSQLKGLGAILAIPVTDGPNPEYKIIRNLDQRPSKLLREDISKIQRIYWVDDKSPSVAGVMEALGLQGMRPSHFVAFMPEKLEKKLFEMELKYKGLREDQIHETKFEVVRGPGGYQPRVIDQVPKSAVGR